MAHNKNILICARRCLLRNVRLSNYRYSTSDSKVSQSDQPVFALEEYPEDSAALEAEIETKRNKSRLSEKHRDILMGIPPRQGTYDFHTSLKYKRKMYGLYGSASGIDPGTLWPDKGDLDEVREYESVAYPYSFHETMTRLKAKRDEEYRVIRERQKKIADNVKKLDQWMKEVQAKKEKKLKELEASKLKRDKMLEEVRMQLGQDIDVKDERFQQALAQKEKDMKKQLKAEKTKAKHERLLKSLDPSS